MILDWLNLWDIVMFRLRHGFWCEHVTYWQPPTPEYMAKWGISTWRPDGWITVDCGTRQIRFCAGCSRMETR